MKCKKVRKNFLIFLDRELSDKRSIKIRNHLNGCTDCLKQMQFLSKVWSGEGELERIEASPYLWNKLSQRIAEYEDSRNLFSAFFETIARYAVPATATVVVSVGILIGIYLGSFPNSQNSESSSQSSVVTDKERFAQSSYLDSFADLPPESLGGIYVALESGKE